MNSLLSVYILLSCLMAIPPWMALYNMAKYSLKVTVAKLAEGADGKVGAEVDSASISSHGLSLASVKAMRKELADLFAKWNDADVDVK